MLKNSIFICTYNILYGVKPDVISSLRELAAIARTYRYSFITLQEVRLSTKTSKLVEQIETCFKGFHCTFNMYKEPDVNNLGICTITNCTTTKTAKLTLPQLKKSPWRIQGYFMKQMPLYGAIVSEHKIENDTLQVAVVHLDLAGGYAQKHKQLMALKKELRTDIKHTIILGDFNTIGILPYQHEKVTGEIYKIANDVGTAFNIVGNTNTHTSDIRNAVNPAIPFHTAIEKLPHIGITLEQRTDWILHKGLHIIRSGVYHNLIGSDHYPVWAEMEI